MKFLKIFFVSIFLLSLFSCGSDDDICLEGEATPRMKLKFKTQATGKLKTLDTLIVSVDYGSGKIPVVTKTKVDSILIPLRVDDSPFTKMYIKLGVKSPESEVQINYETKTQYVSPACGMKKYYENTSAQVITHDPVLETEQNQTEIVDENKTHFFLLF